MDHQLAVRCTIQLVSANPPFLLSVSCNPEVVIIVMNDVNSPILFFSFQGLHTVVAVIIAIFLIIEKRQANPYKELNPSESLLKSQSSLFFNSTSSLDKR